MFYIENHWIAAQLITYTQMFFLFKTKYYNLNHKNNLFLEYIKD
jgi:hypothetical protein